MQHHSSNTHNFFSASSYPNPPPVEEQPLVEDRPGMHAQVQPTFDNLNTLNLNTGNNMAQYENYYPSSAYDTAFPLALYQGVRDATASGSTSYGGVYYQPPQLHAPPRQSRETALSGPTFDGPYLGTADLSVPVPPALHTAPFSVPATAFDATFAIPDTTPCKFHYLPDRRTTSDLAQSPVL
ncbi:hypothetical protein BC834DRAFT_673215 [Gloeopeniophorella convolvens]|nr:hypothetical protein BC834DRAFT_673215 [Gloeopeniophorella convolvens]